MLGSVAEDPVDLGGVARNISRLTIVDQGLNILSAWKMDVICCMWISTLRWLGVLDGCLEPVQQDVWSVLLPGLGVYLIYTQIVDRTVWYGIVIMD